MVTIEDISHLRLNLAVIDLDEASESKRLQENEDSADTLGVLCGAEVLRGGITAGNDAAGAGSGEMSAMSRGSAGVMERSAVSKGGGGTRRRSWSLGSGVWSLGWRARGGVYPSLTDSGDFSGLLSGETRAKARDKTEPELVRRWCGGLAVTTAAAAAVAMAVAVLRWRWRCGGAMLHASFPRTWLGTPVATASLI